MRKKTILFLLLFSTVLTFAQVNISGVVKSADDGTPLPGASIQVKGSARGTTTDFDGNYTIEASNEATLVISYIGYATIEVLVGDQITINAILELDVKALDEVVLVGYGTQKKVNLTGAVTQIGSETLEDRPIVSLSEGLQGLIPNLNITSQNGEPGASASFNIRGFASISGNGAPLILVDGVEMNPNLINDADVKSVTVLKDAAASAIYGSRAAFGVVLIETKSGKKNQKTTISFTSNVSLKRPTRLPEIVQSSYEQAVLVNQALVNAGLSPRYTDEFVGNIQAYENDPVNNPEWEVIGGAPGDLGAKYRYYGFTDWAKELINDSALTQKYTLSASGGGEKTSFYASVGHLDQGGLFKNANDSYKRLNTTLKLTNQTFSWLQTRLKMSYNNTVTDRPHNYKSDETVFNSLVFSSPIKPVRYPNDGSEFAGRYFRSPVGYQKFAGRDKFAGNHVLLNIDLKADIDQYLSVVTNFTSNLYNNNTSRYEKKVAFIGSDFLDDFGTTNNDFYFLRNTKTKYFAFNAYTQYERTFGKFYTKNMIGYNQEFTDYDSFSSKVNGLITIDAPAINLGSGEQEVDGDQYELAIRGGFFRSNFIYDNRIY